MPTLIVVVTAQVRDVGVTTGQNDQECSDHEAESEEEAGDEDGE